MEAEELLEAWPLVAETVVEVAGDVEAQSEMGVEGAEPAQVGAECQRETGCGVGSLPEIGVPEDEAFRS